MASVFLPRSASWPVVLAFICSTLISSRRVDMANSARNWSLSARISAIDNGVAASSRRMVRRTARLWTRGTNSNPSSAAARNPIPKNMTGSIMTALLETLGAAYEAQREPYFATLGQGLTLSAGINLNRDRPLRHKTTDQRRQTCDDLDFFLDANRGGCSEGVPGGTGREFQIAEIGAQPKPDAGADRHHHDVVGGECGHAQTANKIGRPGDAAEPLVDRLGTRQVVDQHHGARAGGPGLKPKGGPLPIDAYVAGILGIERAVAIAQAADKGAAGLFTEDIAVRLPPLVAGLFHQRRQAAGDAA